LNENIINTISKVDGVDKVIPCVFDWTSIDVGLGTNYATSILSLEMDTIPKMMELMDLKLIKGTMPIEINDIILHKQVAINKKLVIDDFIGRRISKQETLPEVYHIVGIIDGPSVVSFAPIDFYMDFYQLPYEYLYGGIILPKEGELDKMNQALDTLEPSDYQIDTLTIQEAAAEENITKIGILVSAINIFIILIVSSCIGFLCYIYFSQRRSEFGLLWALGFSRQQVINRAFTEVNSINLIGYIIGILMSLFIGVILNYSYYIPSGDYLKIIDIRCFLGAACSPIFVTLFSLVPVWRMLKKLDPISIIDGTML
jgi:putative ABC transport system permease protein